MAKLIIVVEKVLLAIRFVEPTILFSEKNYMAHKSALELMWQIKNRTYKGDLFGRAN